MSSESKLRVYILGLKNVVIATKIKNSVGWQFYLAGLVLTDLTYLSRNIFFSILMLSYILVIPGFLLLIMLKHELKNHGHIFVLSVGLSILMLMIGGLLLNSLHAFGVARPLSVFTVLAMINLSILLLIYMNRSKTVTINFHKPNRLIRTYGFGLTLLPVFAIFGAIRLNNDASNIITMALFATIAICIPVLIQKKALKPLYPYAVVMIGLSVLLSVSLRGWFMSGHDIQREFYFFQLTSHSGYWDISRYKDAYNACLSITILPTIFSKITHIPDIYIYKAVFQVIFSIALLPIYYLIKELSNSTNAFLCSIIFISFPTFINDLPYLNRQEVAFLFFGMLLFVSFSTIPKKTKTVLSILSITGLVISHYSSSYVALGIILFGWLFNRLIVSSNFGANAKIISTYFSAPMIIISLLLTFIWNSQITHTSSGVISTLTTSMKGLLDNSGAISGDTAYSLVHNKIKSGPELLVDYRNSINYNNSNLTFASPQIMPLTSLGRSISKVSNVESMNSLVRNFIAKSLQVLLIIGLIVMFRRLRVYNTYAVTAFVALGFSSTLLLFLQTILPQLSVEYGTLRFFQQTLIILALPIIIGLRSLLGLVSRKGVYVVIVVCFVFLDLSGFIPQLLGGYTGQLALSNTGDYYQTYYVHKADIAAVQWLSKNYNEQENIDMDHYAQLKFYQVKNNFQTYTPTIIGIINGLTYLDCNNISTNTFDTYINSQPVKYSVNPHLDSSVTILYTNSCSEVIK